MSRSQLISYRSFNDKAIAKQVQDVLANAGLTVGWEDTEKYFDPSFAKNELLNWYHIKLRQEDFAKADELMADFIKGNYEDPDKDYYLYSFSNNELIDILRKRDEWNDYDYYWAGKILEERGITVKEEEIAAFRDDRLKDLKKPWELGIIPFLGAITVLTFSVLFFHYVLAMTCIVFGIYVIVSKRTLPNGQKVPAFTRKDRARAVIILIIAILSTAYILTRGFGYW